MTDPQPDVDVATRWLREAAEELRAAELVAAHEELPDRVAGFHAHLAAEKALKAILIRLDVEVPRMHDLIGLHRLLPESEQGRFDGSASRRRTLGRSKVGTQQTCPIPIVR